MGSEEDHGRAVALVNRGQLQHKAIWRRCDSSNVQVTFDTVYGRNTCERCVVMMARHDGTQ